MESEPSDCKHADAKILHIGGGRVQAICVSCDSLMSTPFQAINRKYLEQMFVEDVCHNCSDAMSCWETERFIKPLPSILKALCKKGGELLFYKPPENYWELLAQFKVYMKGVGLC